MSVSYCMKRMPVDVSYLFSVYLAIKWCFPILECPINLNQPYQILLWVWSLPFHSKPQNLDPTYRIYKDFLVALDGKKTSFCIWGNMTCN